jgi:inner membrane protein
MDTITHAFAGALLGKGLFTTRRSESPTEHSQQSGVAIFAVTVASAFPDIDVFYNNFAHDNLGMLKYHRYVTHSLVMLPIWVLLLTPLIRWGARMFGFTPPSFLWTALASAVGIASHILLDLVTSFGTMIWSPVNRARPAWDIIFIVDFIMSAILLTPQMAAWVHRDPARNVRRASRMWALFTLLALGVHWFTTANGYPFSAWVVPIASVVFAAIFFLPLMGNRGAKIRRVTWARCGLLAATAYLLLCTFAHHVALTQLRIYRAK